MLFIKYVIIKYLILNVFQELLNKYFEENENMLLRIKAQVQPGQLTIEQEELIDSVIDFYGWIRDSRVIFYYSIATIIFGIITLIIHTTMIIGIKKEQSNLMIPGLIQVALEIVVGLIMTIVYAVLVKQYMHLPVAAIVVMIIINLAWLALCTYFWLSIYSHYQEVKEEQNGFGNMNKASNATLEIALSKV